MSRELKHLSFTNIKAKSAGRIRVGVCAVMGNVDAWGDRIHPGAFTKTIAENIKQIRHLWMHDSGEPPIAKIIELRELTKEELPAEVLLKAPEATGGLLVSREYKNSQRASDVLECIDDGDINEMSFAFDVVKSAQTEEETDFPDMPKRYIRELYELKLYDTSDVNWGMNGATVAAGAKHFSQLPLGAILNHLQFYQTQLKAGSRNSAADAALIDSLHSIAVELGATCAKADDEAKNNSTNDESDKTNEAEAVKNDTSLNQYLAVKSLEIDNLTI